MTQTYEAWRITYQSSEHAARAAFERMMELEQGNCLHQIAEPAENRFEALISYLRERMKYSHARHGHTSRFVELKLEDAQEIESILCSAKLAAAPQAVQPAVPDGWKLVPMEPQDMQQVAGAQAIRLDTTVINKMWTANKVYREMVAAAPAHPAEGVPTSSELRERLARLKATCNAHTTPAVYDAIADSEAALDELDEARQRVGISLAATQPAAQGLDVEPKLNAAWKARLLDGAPLSRDKYGCGSHPALPIFFEGVKCKDFFGALGIELRLWFAEFEMEVEAYEAMSDGFTEDGENYNAWTPKAPEGDGWCLVAIFDTEDGAACWWLRDAALAAQAKQGGAA